MAPLQLPHVQQLWTVTGYWHAINNNNNNNNNFWWNILHTESNYGGKSSRHFQQNLSAFIRGWQLVAVGVTWPFWIMWHQLEEMASKHPQHTSGENETLVKNLAHFAELVKDLEIPPTRTMISYDVSALFTSIPTCEAKKVIRDCLKKDKTLPTRSELNVDQLVTLLELCLDTTYFMFFFTIIWLCVQNV